MNEISSSSTKQPSRADSLPSQNPDLRRIIELCSQHDASTRPTFSNILCYLEQVATPTTLSNLSRTAIAPEVPPAVTTEASDKAAKLQFKDYYQKMMEM